MRALTVEPHKANSARLDEIAKWHGPPGAVMLEMLAVGVCGTDRAIIAGQHGVAPPGRSRLVLGHESVARVIDRADSEFGLGELVVPIVRRPDPVPCANCAVGEWDMCRNGRYTEHGIKELDGFCAERVSMDPQYLVHVPPELGTLAVLLEPMSIVAKAWQHIEHIGHRTHWAPKNVVVTGAGPIGLLGALLGRQRGLDVYVYDRATDGPKRELVRALGAHYNSAGLIDLLQQLPADIILECTGADPVVLDVMRANAGGAIACLVGVSSRGRKLPVDVGGLNRSIVLENDVIFGSVNANRGHYEAGARALALADRGWLDALLSRRMPLEQWSAALERRPGDVKVVIELAH